MTREEVLELLNPDFFTGVKEIEVAVTIEYNTQTYDDCSFSGRGSLKNFSEWIDAVRRQSEKAVNLYIGLITFRLHGRRYSIRPLEFGKKWEYRREGIFGGATVITTGTQPKSARSIASYFIKPIFKKRRW